MGRRILCLLAFSLLYTSIYAEEADPIPAKLTAARDQFFADRDKAEKVLLDLLARREAIAKQAGDLKTLDAVRAEVDAFRQKGVLPKFVSTTTYENTIKAAVLKLDNAYMLAIKTYTRNDKIEEARAVQTKLDELKNALLKNQRLDGSAEKPKPVDAAAATSSSVANDQTKSASKAVAQDQLLSNTTWMTDDKKLVLFISAREQASIRALVKIPNIKSVREFQGTLDNGKITFLGKEMKELSGDAGIGDHYATYIKNDQEHKLLLEWFDPNKNKNGSAVLKLVNNNEIQQSTANHPENDPLQVNSAWHSDDGHVELVLTITQRNKNTIQAHLLYPKTGAVKELNGTILDDKIVWPAKDSKTLKGQLGDSDHESSHSKDQKGFVVKFFWQDPVSKKSGTRYFRPFVAQNK